MTSINVYDTTSKEIENIANKFDFSIPELFEHIFEDNKEEIIRLLKDDGYISCTKE